MISRTERKKKAFAWVVLFALLFSICVPFAAVFAEEPRSTSSVEEENATKEDSESTTGAAITYSPLESGDTVKVTMILGSASTYVPQLSSAYELIKETGYSLDVKLYSTKAVRDYPDVMKERLAETDVLMLEMIGQETMDTLLKMIQSDLKGKCFITNTTVVYGENEIDYTKSDEIKKYFTNTGVENMRRLLLLLGTWSETPLQVSEAIEPIASPLPTDIGFIYHPQAKKLPFNTDRLSEKISELGTDPQTLKLIYDSIVQACATITDEEVKELALNLGKATLQFTANLSDTELNEVLSLESSGTDAEIIEIINTSKNKVADLEGVFETLDGYLGWYKGSGKMKKDGPWVGVTTQRTWYVAEDIQMQLDLIDRIEAKDGNVLFAIPPTSSSNRDKFVRKLFMKDGKSQVDVLITVLGFNFFSTAEKSVDLFKELGVPVLAPTQTDSLDEWEKDKYGNQVSLTTQVALPELDGRIEPIFLGGIKEVEDKDGNYIEKRMPLDYNTDRLAGRALAWAKMKKAENADKKVALIYYNHDGGKDGIKASYLNVADSASNVLTRLKTEGYNFDGDLDLSSEGLKKLIDEKGRNIGSWAPGCLDTLVQAGAITIPLEDYLSWYQKLPASMRAEVETQWGEAPGNVMVQNGEIVIPGTKMGNVFFGPQPMRGWGDDPDSITHSATLPPTHQYLAFYLWLQNEFEADAVIHLGTHGTLEWLPGRIVGQGEDDYSDQLIGNMVNVYPYIVNNPGEAVQAKRRSYGVTIGHMIPPMLQAGLYGELQELQTLMIDYRTLVSDGLTEQANVKKDFILEKVKALGYEAQYGDAFETDFDKAVEQLHHELEELAEELMPYGLHTLGTAMSGNVLDQMVDSIVNYDKENREPLRDSIRAGLLAVPSELDAIIAALNGSYIEPGPARDPIRVLDAMPTGRNLVPFDPRQVPDRAAWETGKKAADALIEAYKQEKGEYPDSVGVVLWAIETMRTRGETVAVIMRLIGVEPVYGSGDKVTEVKVTPIEELNRPRIDVLVTISGLFRDTFGTTIDVLDDAFRKVAALDESSDQNKVRKNYLALKDKLVNSGVEETEAESLAASRIYGSAPGSYGTGVSDLTETTSAWEKQDDLIEAYMNRMSYIYGKGVFGKQATESFIENLKNVSTITQVRDSIWGTLDNDDVAQYLGGLKLAAEKYSGKDLLTYIINTRENGDPNVQTLEEFVRTEIRSRVLNPKWIEGMLKDGYAGAAEIGDHIKNMFLMDATAGAIDDWSWQEIAETYIFNDEIRAQLDPYIVQSIIGWNMEAARRDMWSTDKATLEKLADTYVQTLVKNGVVCCHHTCGNIVFNEWVAEYSTLDKDTLKQFETMLAEATNKDVNIKIEDTTKTKSKKEQQETTVPVTQEVSKEPVQTAETEPAPKTDTQPVASIPAAEELKQTSNEEMQISQKSVKPAAGQEEKENTLIAENASSAGKQPETAKPEDGENAQEITTKAYELTEKENAQSNTGKKAVAAGAIVMAMSVVGLFLKGYLAKGK
ncbi:cobaltochelatase subunit CobN [Sinanaerobacter sp. ZZT-01]|uniref:cobaltochelatase subunit CobN n=1 Tax=Sinanaerobacter sp. ZZT-01 TaxID=3111540 RepID=UPI002D77ED30|nr:cobaltochelatase subunit CobN [Sinanaerobacter sp. ZZT-01]WRR92390.1 cobaltochelatase subunit CobN [Sinanaerobacter sp. ZZT-01]